MCVENTRIFARLSGRGTQYLVYQMAYQALNPLAMVLPLPVSSHAEDAVGFLSLDGYPQFFDDLNRLFTESELYQTKSLSLEPAGGLLSVYSVGSYNASFVPTVGDFHRLDSQFRLPDQIWSQLPAYADYGFAVFMLSIDKREETDPRNPSPNLATTVQTPSDVRAAARRTLDASYAQTHPIDARYAELKAKFRPVEKAPPSAELEVHPIAFEFPTSLPGSLYFPTLHIHDGVVHESEQFDHALFWQGEAAENPSHTMESRRGAEAFVNIDQALGIVNGPSVVYKLSIDTVRKNEDIVLQ